MPSGSHLPRNQRRSCSTPSRVVERNDEKAVSRRALRPGAGSRRGRRGHPVLQAPFLGAADSKRRICPGIRGGLFGVPEASMGAAAARSGHQTEITRPAPNSGSQRRRSRAAATPPVPGNPEVARGAPARDDFQNLWDVDVYARPEAAPSRPKRCDALARTWLAPVRARLLLAWARRCPAAPWAASSYEYSRSGSWRPRLVQAPGGSNRENWPMAPTGVTIPQLCAGSSPRCSAA